MKQELALRCGGVHPLGERTERDAMRLEIVHGREEMGQRPTKAIKFSTPRGLITRPNEGECRSQASAITPTATDMILEQVALINASREQCVALQVQHLPIAIG